jgi:hypothetical protein
LRAIEDCVGCEATPAGRLTPAQPSIAGSGAARFTFLIVNLPVTGTVQTSIAPAAFTTTTTSGNETLHMAQSL